MTGQEKVVTGQDKVGDWTGESGVTGQEKVVTGQEKVV